MANEVGREGAHGLSAVTDHPQRTRVEPPGALAITEFEYVKRRRTQRERRHRQQVAWDMADLRERYEVLPGGVLPPEARFPRSAGCGVTLGPSAVEVGTYGDGGATLTNVARCHDINRCPVCAPVMREERAAEVAELLEAHFSNGGEAYMVTLTVRHKRGDALSEVLSWLFGAWNHLQHSRAWMGTRKSLGYLGFVKSLEVMYGLNGWGPHFHLIFLVDGKATDEGAEAMRSTMYRVWRRGIEKLGGRLPSEEHGVDVQPVGASSAEAVGRYCSKFVEGFEGLGDEMGRLDEKHGRREGSITPFQLLDEDTLENRRLWLEYSEAMEGVWSVYMSRGLRAKVGMAKKDEAEERPVPKAWMDPALYRAARKVPGRVPEFLSLVAAGRMEEAAESVGGVLLGYLDTGRLSVDPAEGRAAPVVRAKRGAFRPLLEERASVALIGLPPRVFSR